MELSGESGLRQPEIHHRANGDLLIESVEDLTTIPPTPLVGVGSTKA
jgi:hypothetical protein